MALKIRLRQQGRNNRASYRVVVTDVRSPRDGKYVEALGWYNPLANELEKQMSLKTERIQHWLNLGAQLSENVETLIAHSAPDLVRQHAEKVIAKRVKRREKRKAQKQSA